MTTQLPTLYTLTDLNAAYGWSLDTLRDYVNSGELPASRVGRAFVVTADGLEEFLARRAVARRADGTHRADDTDDE